jgi:prefoldin beta subunit
MVDLDSSKIVGQFQMYQQQYQTILMQKEQLRLQKLEVENALEELEAGKSKKVYKISGPIMIKKDVEDIKIELGERNEDLELRLKTLKRAEERVTKNLKDIEEKVKKMMK